VIANCKKEKIFLTNFISQLKISLQFLPSR